MAERLSLAGRAAALLTALCLLLADVSAGRTVPVQAYQTQSVSEREALMAL